MVQGSLLAAPAQDADALAGKRMVFLGDSITQSGGYVAFTTYHLKKLSPKKDSDIIASDWRAKHCRD